MTPKHHLQWRQTHPIAMFAASAWHDSGAPCGYNLSFYPDRETWQASFEGATLHEGTLQECLLACQENEYNTVEDVPHWHYEDNLPDDYPYDRMFSRSKVICGIRMFPPAT